MSATEGNHGDSHADQHSHGPPPPPEPRTPLWLPAVGALLFLAAGLFWALGTPAVGNADVSGNPAGSATATATATAPSTAAAAPPHRGPGRR